MKLQLPILSASLVFAALCLGWMGDDLAGDDAKATPLRENNLFPSSIVAIEMDKTGGLPAKAEARWRQTSTLPPMAGFQRWANDYARAPMAGKVAAGIQAATERRKELQRLIREDPEQALAHAVPESVRRAMPLEVRGLLEEWVDARGDLLVEDATLANGGPRAGQPAASTKALLNDGREFDAFTCGRQEGRASRTDVAVHGIALDGLLAVSE